MKKNGIRKSILFAVLFIPCPLFACYRTRKIASKSAARFLRRDISSQSFKILQAITRFKERTGFSLTLENYNKQQKEEDNHGFEYEILKTYDLEMRGKKIVAFNFCHGTKKHAIDFLAETGECYECKSGTWPQKLSGKKSRKLKTQLKQQNSMIKKLNKKFVKESIKYQHIVLSKQNIPTCWTKFLAQLGITFEIG